MGLIATSGAVVAEGADGFRAERAVLRCLFTDRPWSWRSLASGAWDRGDWPLLRSIAADHAVPLLSLSNAVRLGLLGDAGVPEDRIAEAASLGAAFLPPGLRGRLSVDADAGRSAGYEAESASSRRRPAGRRP
jgi:hypothetical protein